MLTAIRRGLRLLQINAVLIRHGLDEVILATPLLRPVRFTLYLLPWNWVRGRNRAPRAVRLRRALEELGPIFVKFGQIVSTRRDLLPDDIADELGRLQDRVAPFPGSEAREIIESSLEQDIDAVFEHFETEPMASASIAQVHAARLKDGRDVVVKVVRPRIEQVIRRDVAILYLIADLAERYWAEGRRLRPHAAVAEYESTILDELDLLREAASCSQLRRNFDGSDLLYIPEVVWDLSRSNVMVMERVYGVPINDMARLNAAGVNLQVLAERGVEIFFKQVLTHNFFHADMHPGNIFVSLDNPERPGYVAVDFGIVGSLTPEDRRYLAENFFAFFNRDYHRVAELHVQSGWVPRDTRLHDFEAAIRTVCEPIFERPLKDISFGRLLLRLFQVARRFNMEVQPQLLLLQKTLLAIEGLGRQLYPELDLWQTAKPLIESWMRDQIGPRAVTKTLLAQAPRWGEALPQLPMMAHEVLTQAREGKLRLEMESVQLAQLRQDLRRTNQRTVLAVTGAALLAAVAIPLVGGESVTWLAWVFGIIGVGLVGYAFAGETD